MVATVFVSGTFRLGVLTDGSAFPLSPSRLGFLPEDVVRRIYLQPNDAVHVCFKVQIEVPELGRAELDETPQDASRVVLVGSCHR